MLPSGFKRKIPGSMKNFKERFHKLLISKLVIKLEDIQPNENFAEDLGADSLDMVELIVTFESEFTLPFRMMRKLT